MRSAAGGWSRRGPRCSRELEAAGSLAPRPPRARLRAFIFNEEFLLPSRTPPRLLRTSLGSGRGGLPLLGSAASFWSSSLSLPPLLGSDGFFLSPVPALKGTRPLPRAHAHTHSPLTSLVRSPVKPSAFPPPPRSLCQGAWEAPGPLTQPETRTQGGPAHCFLGPATSAGHPLCAQLCRPGGPEKAECGGLGKAALCWKGKPDPWRGGRDGSPAPCCGLVPLLQPRGPGGARPAETDGPGGLGPGSEGHKLCSGLSRGSSPHPPLGPSSSADGSGKWFKHSGKHLVAFSKVEHTPSIWSGHSPPRHLSQRKENSCPRGLGHECSPQLHL